ncbi:hypothetical protein JCM17960_34950 [Magnetospira thiophila]
MDLPAPRTEAITPPENASLEELREYLWRVHRVTVGADDPILLLHSLHRAFLADTERLLARHGEVLQASVATAARGFSAEILGSIEAFRDKALTAGLENRLEQMTAQVRLADRIRGRLRSALLLLSVLTLINVGAVALALAVLLHILR